jgi:hypothetical protein
MMIGGAGRVGESVFVSKPDEGRTLSPEVRWGVGCLLGGAALTGGIILMMLAAYALQPPTWLQIAMGALLALGGALFAGLIASALGQSRDRSKELRAVDDPKDGSPPG